MMVMLLAACKNWAGLVSPSYQFLGRKEKERREASSALLSPKLRLNPSLFFQMVVRALLGVFEATVTPGFILIVVSLPSCISNLPTHLLTARSAFFSPGLLVQD